MPQASPAVFRDYLGVLERAILQLRMRIRYDDKVTIREVHDLLDAIHNIPEMLRNYGQWHVEENIDAALARYDKNWFNEGDAKLRTSLIETLRRIRNGEWNLPLDEPKS